MSRAGTYGDGDVRHRGSAVAKDIETWLANSLATLLAGFGVAGGVVGFFVAMGYADHPNSLTDFDAGLVWMFGGLILAVAGNVFRREHHVVDPKEVEPSTYGSSERYRTERPPSEPYRGETRTR